MSISCPGPGLRGRRTERAALDRLLAEVRAGQSRVLVLRGEAGVGKTALLDYVHEQASGFRMARAVGVESEMELAFAGLHQLCTPMLSKLAGLPGPQRDALRTVFGLSTGVAPDRLLVGLAVLGLLSEVAEELPLVCLVDDAQWLDQASAQARSQGRVLGLAWYAIAVLYNGLGGYEAALAGARRACEYEDLGFFGWSLAELVEAAASAPADSSGITWRWRNPDGGPGHPAAGLTFMAQCAGAHITDVNARTHPSSPARRS